MDYLITARKWRPHTFSDVIGQKHVTQTIENAIKTNRLGQSYLFSGPRGVGKTTLARIIVKALNCENGPTVSPCNKCSFCTEINENRSMDYMEIDGASNRGIDQIREINNSLKYASPNQKHRIIVIDEVHMLTIEAFNALLKNLEEPPPKVIFIFCTTEPHKVPATIRSRCQHHSFKSFPIDEITLQLKKILDNENKKYEEEAVFHIAKAASGSMRDSQNILDQVLSYAGDSISSNSVLDVLGLSSSDLQFTFLTNLHTGNLSNNYRLVSGVVGEGKDLKQFILSILSLVQSTLLIKEGIEDHGLLELTNEDFSRCKELTANFSREHIFLITDICYEFIKALNGTADEKVTSDFFIIKLHRYKNLISPELLKAELINISAGIHKQSDTTVKEQPSPLVVQNKTESVSVVPVAAPPNKITQESVNKNSDLPTQTVTVNFAELDYNVTCVELEKIDKEIYAQSKLFKFKQFNNNTLFLENVGEVADKVKAEQFRLKLSEIIKKNVVLEMGESDKNNDYSESVQNAMKVFGKNITKQE